MKRASMLLIAGVILLVTSVVVFAVFIYKSASLAETLPDISVKDVVKYSLNKFSDTDNASIQESKKRIVFDMAIIFFGIVSGIVLLINGIITLIGGAIMGISDRGKKQ
jgi:hypothetical protein